MKTGNQGFRICVFGAQFGSEGKGCAAEYLIKRYRNPEKRLVVYGENAPNSGHTNTIGKTRSMPVSAYLADVCILGPDSAIDPTILTKEVIAVKAVNPNLQVYVHENAALITLNSIHNEQQSGIEQSISSTVTGGGAARTSKALHRDRRFTMYEERTRAAGYTIVDQVEYFELLADLGEEDSLFECSQGLMLDLNLGYYPYVTSRTTHPRAVIERNGLGPSGDWLFAGAYRTYPIRTGGNSGPTGGRELSWEEVGVPKEIAVVTKRVRRVFEFSGADFIRSLNLVRPQFLMFTHLDYLQEVAQTPHGFLDWLGRSVGIGSTLLEHPLLRHVPIYGSMQPSKFEVIRLPYEDRGGAA